MYVLWLGIVAASGLFDLFVWEIVARLILQG